VTAVQGSGERAIEIIREVLEDERLHPEPSADGAFDFPGCSACEAIQELDRLSALLVQRDRQEKALRDAEERVAALSTTISVERDREDFREGQRLRRIQALEENLRQHEVRLRGIGQAAEREPLRVIECSSVALLSWADDMAAALSSSPAGEDEETRDG